MEMMFDPIVVERGRKFKGHGYAIGEGYTIEHWAYSIENTKIWDPVAKKITYANSKFVCADESATPEQIALDKQAYIDTVVEDTIRYCKSKSTCLDSSSTHQWIRNSLLKKLPKDIVDSVCPDQRSVAEEVEKTLRWAMTLVSSPAVMYGKVCKGGKPYSKTRKAEIAYRHLKKNGMTDKPEFESCWMVWTSIFNLPDVRSKVEAKIDKERQQY